MFEETFETLAIIQQSLKPLRASRWKMTKQLLYHLVLQTSTLQLAVFAFFLCLLAWCVLAFQQEKRLQRSRIARLALPRFDSVKNHKWDLQGILEDARKLYPGSPYVITSPGFELVVCPSEMWDEVKKLPADVADMRDSYQTAFYGQYTGIGHESDGMMSAVSTDAMRCQPSQVHERQTVTRHALARFIGVCDDWTAITLFQTMFHVISYINACAFVGKELGNDASYLSIVDKYLMNVIGASFALNKLPQWLRQLLAPVAFLPAWKVRRDYKQKLLTIIRPDMEKFYHTDDKIPLLKAVVGERLPLTMWFLHHSKIPVSEDVLVRDHLLLSLEAMASPSTALYGTLIRLATRPELVEELREEIEANSENGKLPLTQLNELRLMDSVVSESFRLEPTSLFLANRDDAKVTLQRRLQKPFQLSSGPILPTGTIVTVDVHNIHNSAQIWKDPGTFKPRRYYELAEKTGNELGYSFGTQSSHCPGFGGGKQACPGRTYAASLVKITLATILMRYDIKLISGFVSRERAAMPSGAMLSDLNTKLLFKSRAGSW